MLTPVGKDFLKIAKTGFKNPDELNVFSFPLKM